MSWVCCYYWLLEKEVEQQRMKGKVQSAWPLSLLAQQCSMKTTPLPLASRPLVVSPLLLPHCQSDIALSLRRRQAVALRGPLLQQQQIETKKKDDRCRRLRRSMAV